MDYGRLKAEVANDPLGVGYPAMTDQQVADSLNAKTRSVDREELAAWQVIEATVPANWAALTAAEKDRYRTFVSAGTLNPKGANTRAAFQAMFQGTATMTNLVALLTETVSRASELGLGLVYAEHVAAARSV